MGAELDMNTNMDTMPTEAARPMLATEPAVAVSTLRSRLTWLDPGTAELLVEIAIDLGRAHSEVGALILFGSLARHEERPLGAGRPSDIDLLVLVRTTPELTNARIPLEQKLSIYHTIGEREYQHPGPSLEVQVVLANETLSGWDDQFIANVARDGVLLWSRICLPDALAQIADRGATFVPPPPSNEGQTED